MSKTLSILRQSLGLQSVAGLQSPRFLRLVGLLAFANVALATLTSPITHAQDLDKGLQAYNAGDFRTALKEWRPLAESGNSQAQFYLGQAYENGDGVLQNEETAAEWYFRAAVQDHLEAQINLGNMYRQGKGVRQNNEVAHVWLNIASISGNREARQARDEVQNSLSSEELSNARSQAQQCLDSEYKNCLTSTAIARKIAEAEAEAERQAEAEAEARRLAQLSPLDRGLEAYRKWNYATALREFRASAEQGNRSAQYYLGLMHERGVGVEQNHTTAVAWYRKAAEQGHGGAQLALRRLQ